MTKTVSVGLVEEAKINYITFQLHSQSELVFFCEDLASYIINKYNKYFLRYIIHKNYGYFNKSEKQAVYELAKKSFSNIYSEGETIEQSLIQTKLYDYFVEEQTDTIVLEGFIQFRLMNSFEELEWIVDSAVDEFMIKKEYENFISMLKQFVNAQVPVIRLIHICPQLDGRYELYDENFETLTDSQILGLDPDILESFVNDDDLLLSALISIAPKKIWIHNLQCFANRQLYDTIQKVFPERVSICNGCEKCSKNNLPVQIKSNLYELD